MCNVCLAAVKNLHTRSLDGGTVESLSPFGPRSISCSRPTDSPMSASLGQSFGALD